MQEIVITGVGVVSPIGVGREAFEASLRAGRGGVRTIDTFDSSGLPVHIAGEVTNFDPKQYVKPRKSLKVMSREIQFAYASASLACQDAELDLDNINPERLGVVYGSDLICCDLEEVVSAYRSCLVDGRFDFTRWGEHALSELYPLWMLKYLPNMPACHVGIACDARGPTNSILLGEVSALLALAEGVSVIERGHADAMIVGGVAARLHPTAIAYRGDKMHSHRNDDPAAACRPFDADRDGMVLGEGAGAVLLESREHAERRGAPIHARVLGCASNFAAPDKTGATDGAAIRASILGALRAARIEPGQVGHVNAHGLSTRLHDPIEARAIRDCLGDVLVTAPKSYFGNLSAGAGAVEMAVSLFALRERQAPPTLNYETPDETCPVRVVAGSPQPLPSNIALILNQSSTGQAAAVVLCGE